jgi:hypothetical protein
MPWLLLGLLGLLLPVELLFMIRVAVLAIL